MSDELDALFDELEVKKDDIPETKVEEALDKAEKEKEPEKVTKTEEEVAFIEKLSQTIPAVIAQNDDGEGAEFDKIQSQMNKRFKKRLTKDQIDDAIFVAANRGEVYQPNPDKYKTMLEKDDAPATTPTKTEKSVEQELNQLTKTEDGDLALEELLGVEPDPEATTTETALTKPGGKELARKGDFYVATVKDVPEHFMIDLNGAPYILHAGLLWLGKKAKVNYIKSEALINSWEHEDGYAKYRCIVRTEYGEEYDVEAVAIPNGKNVKMRTMFPYMDALAQTRAINIALRKATNCGFVSAEEMPDFEGELP